MDDPRIKTAGCCETHTDINFPYDDECPLCVDAEDSECCYPFLSRVEALEKENTILRAKLKEERQKNEQNGVK